MRILGIRFKNLNSLTGEWQIDFTHPDYSSNGIFAIVGPTGSGKTTILDALCLGLYGMTPRLQRVTQSSNEILSRQTGDCFAEVTFETQEGSYRCHWSQHRARRKPDGELQPARREIADADSGAVLESKMSQVDAFVEKVTGMDFERFTRSMLLAQGGFAAFLQASPDKRAPILEQITGTEIYSRISTKVHERYRAEHEKLEFLQAELKGIQVLTEEDEKALLDGLRERQEHEIKLAERVDALHKALTWLEGITVLEKELQELDRQQQDFEKRKKDFEPEAGRLERARKALDLEGDYSSVVSLRRQQDGDVQELNSVTALLPEKEKACADASTTQREAEIGLNAARDKAIAEAEIIKKVRECDARLGEKQKQIEEKDRAIEANEKQGKEYKESLEKSAQAVQQSQSNLQAVSDYLSRHVADAALPEKLAAVGKEFAAVCDLEAKRITTLKDIEKAAASKQAATAACQKMEADHKAISKEFEKAQGELKQLADEMTAILNGREISAWRSDTDGFKERERSLIRIGEIIERIDKADTTITGFAKDLETLKAAHVEIFKNIQSVVEQKSKNENNIENMEMQVTLLSRIRDLEEDRKRLEDGSPCPLCGATDHPYARGNVPELNQAEASLKAAKAENKKLSEKLRKLETDQAEMGAKVRHIERDITEKKTALDADEKECTGNLTMLGIEATRKDRTAKVSGELADVRAKISETTGIVAAAEEKSKKEKTARAVLEKTQQKFENIGRALQEARYKLETAGHEEVRLTKECGALTEEVKKALAATRQDIEPFGITQISLSELNDILKDLTARKDAWQAKQEERIACEKRMADLKAVIDRDTALLGNLEKDLATRRQEYEALIKEYKILSVSRRELFGDKNPDQEEKRLADAVKQAGDVFEKARETSVQLEKESGILKEKAETLNGSITARAKGLVQSEQRLNERIKKAGFTDETDFRLSCLDEKEREKLATREESLIREKAALDARLKDRKETLVTEKGKALIELSDGAAEALKEYIAASDSDLKQIRQDIGAMTQSLDENKRQRERQQERVKRIDAQKKECARWIDLHGLIGSADGKKFRNFAQGLTFDMMTKHANRQLRKMTDRYLLIRDSSQPLELNVIDNYQAGEIRSTKNLSGGESFIVSLALALGLSHMASRNVRVDSLFLDEGFGTLDEDALETALETLAGLQQDGKLIGVISHVPAFKERIATQIQVIPETGGRSILCGPGCQKI